MFANVVQPSVVSLFSSTGSSSLQLFSKHVDASPALRSDSFIHLLNDTTSTPPPPEPGVLVEVFSIRNSTVKYGNEEEEIMEDDRTLCQTVLHIQSPTLRTTYIRCPPHQAASSPSGVDMELGITLPWMHLQVRRLGEREWTFEVGIVDHGGRKGIIRCSTFQKEATVATHHDPPLLHVPLRFPSASPGRLTSWSTISVDLGNMIQQFRTIGAAQRAEARSGELSASEDDVSYHRIKRDDTDLNAPLPSGGLGRIAYVKVFANCRLRRVWFTEDRHTMIPWEFDMYASSRH